MALCKIDCKPLKKRYRFASELTGNGPRRAVIHLLPYNVSTAISRVILIGTEN